MSEFHVLTSEERKFLLRRVDLLMEGFQRLYQQEVMKAGDLGRVRSIQRMRSLVNRWGKFGKIVPADEESVRNNFGLFKEAINNLPKKERGFSTFRSLENILQKFSPYEMEA